MVAYREIDREISWVQHGQYYVRKVVTTERIPVDDVTTCKWCGDPMFDGRIDRQFCSDAHKTAWWRRNRTLDSDDTLRRLKGSDE